jgi:hypothetical protein
MNTRIESLINQFTNNQNVELEQGYYISRCDTVHEENIIYNNEQCILAVETNQVLYTGRKRKIKDYSKVITINIYDKNGIDTDF